LVEAGSERERERLGRRAGRRGSRGTPLTPPTSRFAIGLAMPADRQIDRMAEISVMNFIVSLLLSSLIVLRCSDAVQRAEEGKKKKKVVEWADS